MTDKPLGFVALKSIRQGSPDSQATIAEIREIYFKTTKRTIQHDVVHAIELLERDPNLSAPAHKHLRTALRQQFGQTLQLAQIG